MVVVEAIENFEHASRPWIFLGGSIEMGKAEDWQMWAIDRLASASCTILNPRRRDWDSTWEQSIHDERFRTQVEWELQAQEQADWLLYHFLPGTKSPITLLELGLFARTEKVVVSCPDGFWRKGNVEILCDRYQIPLFDNLGFALTAIRAAMGTPVRADV